jgi:hypothetical protein
LASLAVWAAHRVERETKFLVKGGSDSAGLDIPKGDASRFTALNLIKRDQELPLENVESNSIHIVLPCRYLANGIAIILARSPEVELVSQLQDVVFVELLRPVEQNVAVHRKPKADVAIAQDGYEARPTAHPGRARRSS